MQYNVSVIVVTYNGSKWVDKCFGSLNVSTIPLKIIAIDNNSKDGTPKIISEKFPEVEILQTNNNLGFGKANNIGIKKAIEESADYVFLLNQDAWIEPDSIEKLILVSKKSPDYGILSPIQFNGKGDAIDYNFSTYLSPEITPNFYSDSVLNKLKPIYDSKYINAAAWLVTKHCISVVGGFNPLFKHYGEDDEYIYRVLKKGLKVGIVPNSKIYHDRNRGVANIGMYNKNYLYTQALLSIFSCKERPKIHFLLRRIFGNFIFVILFFRKNKTYRWNIKRDILIVKLLKKTKKDKPLFY